MKSTAGTRPKVKTPLKGPVIPVNPSCVIRIASQCCVSELSKILRWRVYSLPHGMHAQTISLKGERSNICVSRAPHGMQIHHIRAFLTKPRFSVVERNNVSTRFLSTQYVNMSQNALKYNSTLTPPPPQATQ